MQVLAQKLAYISCKQLGFGSPPVILVMGMLMLLLNTQR
jgi:hypothetical protein